MQTVTQTGLPKRFENLNQLRKAAREFKGTEHSAIDIQNMILRGGTAFPELNNSIRLCLALLVSYVYTDKWKTGEVTAWPSNERLAMEVGVNERTVRDYLQTLENHGWIFRRYNKKNNRNSNYGINLAPLGMRLKEIETTINSANKELHEKRSKINDELGRSCRTSKEEHTLPPIVQEKNHQSKTLVQSVNNEDCANNEDKQIPEPLNDKKKGLDEEIVETLFNNSDFLETYIAENDRKEQNLLELSRTITMILKRYFPDLRGDAWTNAIHQHGIAAFGAVIVAVEKHDVENKTAYLAKMLLKPDLRQTIMFSLRKLQIFRSHRLTAFGALALEN